MRLIAMCLHPRATIRAVVDANPKRHVLWLAMVGGAVHLVWRVGIGIFGAGGVTAALAALGIMVVAGALFGWVGLYVFGWLYRVVGRWFGGQVQPREVRAAVAWANVPMLLTFGVWVAVALVLWLVTRQSGGDDQTPGLLARTLVLMLVVLPVGGQLWSLVIGSQAVGEVHRFSSWKGFATVLLSLLLVVLVVGVLAALIIPSLIHQFQAPVPAQPSP